MSSRRKMGLARFGARWLWSACCLVCAAAVVSCAASVAQVPAAPAPPAVAPAAAAAPVVAPPAKPEAAAARAAPATSALPPELLKFSDFFQAGAGLVPTTRVLASSGKRVRLVGFMARMEIPSSRAFYLASRPVVCDESGGGSADLPPDAVRVEVPWAKQSEIPFIAGPVEVVGIFGVGSHVESDGRVSAFRLVLDPPAPRAPAPLSFSAISNDRDPRQPSANGLPTPKP
jgi:hypothetical protein